MALLVFGLYAIRGIKGDGGDGVAGEAEDIENGEGRGQARGRGAADVEKRLGVEGERPGQGIDPTEHVRERLQ